MSPCYGYPSTRLTRLGRNLLLLVSLLPESDTLVSSGTSSISSLVPLVSSCTCSTPSIVLLLSSRTCLLYPEYSTSCIVDVVVWYVVVRRRRLVPPLVFKPSWWPPYLISRLGVRIQGFRPIIFHRSTTLSLRAYLSAELAFGYPSLFGDASLKRVAAPRIDLRHYDVSESFS